MLKRTYLRLVEMQEEQARQHLEEVRSIHNEMRGYKHDFHHHLQALKGQLEAGQVDRAIAYLEQLDRSLQTVDTLLKTGNVTVDAILSAKLAQARAAGIAVTAEATSSKAAELTGSCRKLTTRNTTASPTHSQRSSSSRIVFCFICLYSVKTVIFIRFVYFNSFTVCFDCVRSPFC